MKQKIYEKGITLIALVITIIILLILAGVTISIVFNDGIAKKSQTAVDKYSKESAREKLDLAILDYKMGKITGENKTFEEIIAEEKGTVTHNEEDGKYKVILGGYEFTVDDTTYEVEGTEKGPTTPEKPVEVTKYTVTISKGTGIETVTETQQVEKGKSITISATASTGYEFLKWNVTIGNASDLESLTSATTKVTVNGNITLEATAEKTTVNPVAPSETIVTGENATINGEDFAYTNPVIPVGFKTSNEGASWEDTDNDGIIDGWNDGLVIEDGDGNQFVWVPVDGINVTYGYHYNKNGSGSESLEQSLPSGITNEKTQINTYHGFYIARYEAGIPIDDSNLTTGLTTANASARSKEGTPVSKKNQIPWNFISWSQARTNAQNMYKFENTSNHVQSILITDKMWDTTLQWLEKSTPSVNVTTDCTSWGNYRDTVVTGITEYSTNYGASWTNASSKPGSSSSVFSALLKTGNSEYTNRKNIYDLAGNLWEWTNAKYSSSSSNYALRGGYFDNDGNSGVAAYRNSNSDKATNIRFQVLSVRSVKFCEHVSASKIS